MKIRILGSNGWYSANGYNTVCTLIETNDYYIVLDAGDGIQKLGDYVKDDKPIYLFLSHFHLDHTFGFHIFPKFRFAQTLTVYGQPGTQKTLARLVDHPFTMPFEKLAIKVEIQDLEEGLHKTPEVPFTVETSYLKHADPCFGYRLNIDDKVVTYCTDTGYCDGIVKLARDADLLITECALAPGEEANESWPHLSPELSARAANEARAKKILFTHFSPRNYSNYQDRQKAEVAAQKTFANTVAGNDGMELSL